MATKKWTIHKLRIATCLALVAISIGATAQGAYAAAYNSSTGNGTVSCSTSGTITIAAFRQSNHSNCIGSVVIPNSVTAIDHFVYADKVTSISIPASVTYISDNAFYGTKGNLSFVVASDNNYFSTDSQGALYDKDKSVFVQYPLGKTVTSFTLPSTVSSMYYGAFYEADYLQNLYFEPGINLTRLPTHTIAYSGLRSIEIPEGVTTLGPASFSDLDFLTSIDLPSSLTEIQVQAFSGTLGLSSISIPASVNTLGDAAFAGTSNLRTFVFEGNAPTNVGTGPFGGGFTGARALIGTSATGFRDNTDGDNNPNTWFGLLVTTPTSITYVENSPTSGTAPTQVSTVQDSTYVISSNTGNLEKTNFIFAGWNTNPMGTGTDYAPGSNFTATESNLVLYAKWFYDAYPVSYFGNGNSSGSVPVDSSNPHLYNTNVPVLSSANSLLKTGYTLTSWNTSANGSGTSYSVSGTDSFTMPRAAVNLYAQWRTNSYTLNYASSYSDRGLAPSAATSNYNSSVLIAANSGSLERDGYRFSGWNTLMDGAGTGYSPGDSYTIGASDIVLFPRWKQLPVTPTLRVTKSSLSMSLSWDAPVIGTEFITGFIIQKKIGSGSWANFQTLGTNSTSTSENIEPSLNSLVSYRLATIYDTGSTNWSNEVALSIPTIPLQVTSLVASGGSSDITISWNDPLNIDSSGPLTYLFQITNNGVTWGDFTPSSFPTSTSAVFDSAIGGSSYRFRVKAVNSVGESSWSTSSNLSQLAASYILTYIYDDATSGDSIAEANYTEGESGVNLPNPTRTGYTFAGWFNNPTFTGRAIVSPYAPTDSHSMYAKWTKNPVKANASAKPTISGTAKVSKTLTAKKGTWTGYPAPTISYQWYACSSSISTPKSAVPTSCKKISGATKTSFKIVSAQKGKYVALLVTGSSTGTSKTLWLSKSTIKVS